MEYKNAKSLIERLARQIKLLSIWFSALIFCNALLGFLVWHQSNRRDIVLIPPYLTKKAEITQSGFSSAYLEAMALMLANDRLNITPQNVEGSNQNLLQFVDPEFYVNFKAQLSRESKSITEEKISSSFYVSEVKSNPKKLIVVINGQLKRWVGERAIGTDQKSYQITFVKRGSILLMKSFKESPDSNEGV